MSDRRNPEPVSNGETADRDTRAEALLVEGLDRYFGGRYEEAVHIWTRVLFLDRSHARARAYIDRARTAIGERHRRADEMLHTAESLTAEGELDRARALLTEAAVITGDDERVARVWAEIERVERTRNSRFDLHTSVSPPEPARRDVRAPGAVLRLLAAAALGALLVTTVSSPAVREWFGAHAPGWTPPPFTRQPPPTLSREDVALLRARTLYARGRLAEALRALDSVAVPTGNRAALDALRVEIQSVLLSTRPSTGEPSLPFPAAGRP
jgi:tetratricopeptide (TPR) repeat protein